MIQIVEIVAVPALCVWFLVWSKRHRQTQGDALSQSQRSALGQMRIATYGVLTYNAFVAALMIGVWMSPERAP